MILRAVVIAACVVSVSGSAWASGGEVKEPREGGFVTPCSLDGVNPVFHPEIFGNPAVARHYGFIQARNGTWQVAPGCRR
jgi:hypothetical protein